jgi:hypothetical protein
MVSSRENYHFVTASTTATTVVLRQQCYHVCQSSSFTSFPYRNHGLPIPKHPSSANRWSLTTILQSPINRPNSRNKMDHRNPRNDKHTASCMPHVSDPKGKKAIYLFPVVPCTASSSESGSDTSAVPWRAFPDLRAWRCDIHLATPKR